MKRLSARISDELLEKINDNCKGLKESQGEFIKRMYGYYTHVCNEIRENGNLREALNFANEKIKEQSMKMNEIIEDLRANKAKNFSCTSNNALLKVKLNKARPFWVKAIDWARGKK